MLTVYNIKRTNGVRIKGRQNWIVSYLDVDSNQRLEFIFSLTGNFITFSKRALSEAVAIH